MQRLLLLLLHMYSLHGLLAQDSSGVAPKWVAELLLGGGHGGLVEVRTGPDQYGEIDVAGWFHLGLAAERRISGRWSMRTYLGYESGGWEANTPANPFAAPSSTTDRWTLGAYGVYQLYRGFHSQFTLFAGVRGVLGMNIHTDYRTDTAYVSSSFKQVDLLYRPALVPQAGGAWRWRFRTNPESVMLRAGLEYYTDTYRDADLTSGLTDVPSDLAPLLGTQAGWAYFVDFGLFVLPPAKP